MSSISISGSGSRSLSLTMNDKARTHAQMPTVGGEKPDALQMQLGGASAIIIPLSPLAEIHRFTDDEGDKHYYLVTKGGTSVFARADSWPHASIDARFLDERHYLEEAVAKSQVARPIEMLYDIVLK